MKRKLQFLAAAAMCLMLIACSDDDSATTSTTSSSAPAAAKSSQQSDLLDYIPADTPYVFANLQTMPDDMIDVMWKMADPSMSMYQSMITNALSEGNLPPAVEALLSELDGNMSREGMANMGFAEDGNFAFYGVGVFPVMRMGVADEGKLTAMIDRVMAKAGAEMQKASLGGVSYYMGGDNEGSFVLSVNDGQLVAGIFPTQAKDALLPSVLGTSKPSENIADSGRIEAANKRLGLLPYGTLLIDTVKLTREVLENNSPGSEVFAEVRAGLDAVCVGEFIDMAGVVPGIVYGFDSMTDSSVSQRGVIGIRKDIASGFKDVIRAVPGIGSGGDAMFSFGMGFDILKMKSFLVSRIEAIQNDPYQCAHLQELNNSTSEMLAQINQPLPPFVGNFYGMRMDLLNGNFDGPMPTGVEARVMFGIDNPQSLIMMGAAMMPELAELQIPSNGDPVPLPAGMIPLPMDAPHVSMMSHGIAFSVGNGVQDGLKDYLDADLPSPAPFMAMSYSGDLMDMYLQKMNEFAQAYGQSTMMPSSMEWMDRAEATFVISDRGIEMSGTTYLK